MVRAGNSEGTFLSVGAVSGFLAVALGAFGAHGLRDRLTPDALAIFQTGAHYHLIHAVVVLLVAALLGRWEARGEAFSTALIHAYRAGWLFTIGTVIFAGSLYLLAISGVKILGAITPLGGVAFLSGWLCLLLAGNAARVASRRADG